MKKLTIVLLALVLAVAAPAMAQAAPAAELDRDARQALETLYQHNANAREIGQRAHAVLVFPNIVKAGFIFGGAYGEGALLQGGANIGYFNSISASWGLQAGVQSYGYAVFLMNDKAVKYISDTRGFELGVDPTVVVADAGAAKNLSTSTLQQDAYAFVFSQQGLMAGINIEGTKISRIKR